MVGASFVLATSLGCWSSEDMDAPDAPPALAFQPFTSTTWSLQVTGTAAQLSITDGAGAAACALAQDHQNGLGVAGSQLIVHLPNVGSGACPAGNYTLRSNCASSPGTAAFVTEGCAYYRRWDAQGISLGIIPARNGNITIGGSATSCSINANFGFVGGSFSETFSLNNGTTQPWCGT